MQHFSKFVFFPEEHQPIGTMAIKYDTKVHMSHWIFCLRKIKIPKCSVVKYMHIDFQLKSKRVFVQIPIFFFHLWGGLPKHSPALLKHFRTLCCPQVKRFSHPSTRPCSKTFTLSIKTSSVKCQKCIFKKG